MYTHQNFCLHTFKGKIWAISPGKAAYAFELPSNRLEQGNYRVLGVPENYKLIAELSMVPRAPNTILLLGSPDICSEYLCGFKNASDFLTCMRSLSVDSSLSNKWHKLNRSSFLTFTLLWQFHLDQKGLKSQIAYACHPLKPYFDFLGCSDSFFPTSFISEVVEPRWFMTPESPNRLSKAKSFFSLHKNQFQAAYADSEILLTKNVEKTKNLFILDKLADNCLGDNPIVVEHKKRVEGISNPTDAKRKLLCLYFEFLLRHWLEKLNYPMSFDPSKFFTSKSSEQAYLKYFGAT